MIMIRKNQISQVIFGIVVFGCIWGFLEAITFAGMLHRYWEIFFPYHLCPCFLMSAIFGSFVMGASLAVYKKPSMLIGIGLVATVSGWLSVPFLPDLVREDYYGAWIPSATAIIVGAISLAVVTTFLIKKLESGIPVRVAAGVLSGLIAASIFILVTEYGVDKGICAVLGYARPLPDFLAVGGLFWMGIQAVMLPLGYMVGEKHQHLKESPLGLARLAAIAALFSGGGAIAFAIGL
jgi:hypothetical protein